MSERGIVITTVRFDGTRMNATGGIQAEDLRQYLLYWDKLDYPNNNLISTGHGPDEQFLIDAGVMRRTKINATGFNGDITVGFTLAQVRALQINNHREPGLWSMVQTGRDLLLPPEASHETRTIEFELYNVLPVPTDAVSLDDILLFKDQRNDELMALRVAMDQLYLETIESSDLPRAKTAALNKLEHAINDLHAVTNESLPSRLLHSLKVELNIPSLATGGTIGYAAVPSILGVSPELGAAIGVMAAAFKFEFRVIRRANSLPAQLNDFAYLQGVERELGA